MLSLFNVILYIFIILGIKTNKWKPDIWNPHKRKYVGWIPTSIFSQTCFKFVFFSFIPSISTQCRFRQCNSQIRFTLSFLAGPSSVLFFSHSFIVSFSTFLFIWICNHLKSCFHLHYKMSCLFCFSIFFIFLIPTSKHTISSFVLVSIS
jgi:hypothetical protein